MLVAVIEGDGVRECGVRDGGYLFVVRGCLDFAYGLH